MTRRLPAILMTFMVILLVAAYSYDWVVVCIDSGQRGVLYRRLAGGTVVDRSYGEGVHLIWPWNRMYLYDVRIQERPHALEALTQEGLKVRVVLSIRYHPEIDMLGMLHQTLGPDYADKVVVPETDSAVRNIVLGMSLDSYGTRPVNLQKVVIDTLGKTERHYVQIDDVVIRQIVLPPAVEKAIEDKITQKQLAEAYQFRIEQEQQEKERRRIEAEGIKQYNGIIASSLSGDILQWKGIEASLKLAESQNAKVVIMGNGANNLPILLGNIAGGH